ncbi:hypothetical protein BJX62DRAFT_202484 [Aspergillus germanicus]
MLISTTSIFILRSVPDYRLGSAAQIATPVLSLTNTDHVSASPREVLPSCIPCAPGLCFIVFHSWKVGGAGVNTYVPVLPTCLHDGSEVPAGRGSGKGPQCLQDAFRFQKVLLREIWEYVKGSEFQKCRPLVQCSGSGQDNGQDACCRWPSPSTPVSTADSILVIQAFVESSVDPLQPLCSTRSSLWRPALGSLATCEHDRVS